MGEADDDAEDTADAAAVVEFRRRLAAGEEELIPADIVNRMIDGENKVRVWREYRGITVPDLAERASVDQGRISDIETDAGVGTEGEMKRIAVALRVTLDDLA